MNASWTLTRPLARVSHSVFSGRLSFCRSLIQRRCLLTLAIETSCDDTCVAILSKSTSTGGARLHFNEKITSDNRAWLGVHPAVAVVSHTHNLAPLLQRALSYLPARTTKAGIDDETTLWVDGKPKCKPDFVTVTRGPGMNANLATGLNTAKGLAAAWGVPLLGVNHMEAHALTPRLISALARGHSEEDVTRARAPAEMTRPVVGNGNDIGEGVDTTERHPAFPFLSLLVSGGHTMLVHSRGLCDHAILVSLLSGLAIGDMIDKCARVVLPQDILAASDDVMYGPLLERFAFPDTENSSLGPKYDYIPPPRRAQEIQTFDSGLGWALTPPLSGTSSLAYDFAGFGSQIQRVIEEKPDIGVEERRFLAKHAMRLAFEHLASRLLLVLRDDSDIASSVKTVVVAGGVASNRYLMHILRAMLQVRGFGHLEIVSPHPALCTDNAAMIAWTGLEMYEAGWRSEMSIGPVRKWPMDPNSEGGGILGAGGWSRVP